MGAPGGRQGIAWEAIPVKPVKNASEPSQEASSGLQGKRQIRGI